MTLSSIGLVSASNGPHPASVAVPVEQGCDGVYSLDRLKLTAAVFDCLPLQTAL